LAKAGIILADDQPAVMVEIRSLLEPTYEILDIVTDGEALLEAVGRLHPDLVVSDISMPGMSGLEALRRLREGGVSTPVVFLTIHESEAMVAEAERLGAQGYVLKASADTELELALEEALHGRRFVSPSLRP